MRLLFASETLERCCNEGIAAHAKWGVERAMVIQRRLVQLDAAKNLSVIAGLPGAGLRQRKARRRTIYSVDALHPYEILFEPLSQDGDTLSEAVGIETIETIKVTTIESRHGH